MSLTIEFAGISTLVWNKDRNQAEAVLVDLGAAGFHSHHAVLAAMGGDGITCPEPDTSVAVPALPIELGIWNLEGDVELIADGGPLSVNDDQIDATKPPKDTGSIRWLPELGELCLSRTLAPGVPVAARLPLKTGQVSATAARHDPIQLEFDDDAGLVVPRRYVMARFVVEVPCDKATIRFGEREIRFDGNHHRVVISNTCACEPVARGAAGHFYAHYLLVEAKRKPRVRRIGPFNRTPNIAFFSWPADVEICLCSYVQI